MNNDFKKIFNISNKTYDKLQFIQRIIVPSILTAIGTIGLAIGYGDETTLIVTIIGALNLALGQSLNISSANYSEKTGN